MADHVMQLTPGTKYFAGADLPFFISRSMVESYLTGHGFRDVEWHDREQALPANVNPKLDPLYSDDWTEWASATYAGSQPMSLDPPGDPAWVATETRLTAKPGDQVQPAPTSTLTKTPDTKSAKAVAGLAHMAVTAVVTGLIVAFLRK